MTKQGFGQHQTVHPSLKKILDVLRELPSIDRIIIGVSKGGRHSRPVGSIKLQRIISTGIKMVGYSDRGVSNFTIITFVLIRLTHTTTTF
jgi:hypothetical protein